LERNVPSNYGRFSASRDILFFREEEKGERKKGGDYMEGLMTAIYLIIGLAFFVCWFLAWKKIFKHLGDKSPGSSAIGMFIPMLNIMIIFLTALRLAREEKADKRLIKSPSL